MLLRYFIFDIFEKMYLIHFTIYHYKSYEYSCNN
jgi:hypothetical protein